MTALRPASLQQLRDILETFERTAWTFRKRSHRRTPAHRRRCQLGTLLLLKAALGRSNPDALVRVINPPVGHRASPCSAWRWRNGPSARERSKRVTTYAPWGSSSNASPPRPSRLSIPPGRPRERPSRFPPAVAGDSSHLRRGLTVLRRLPRPGCQPGGHDARSGARATATRSNTPAAREPRSPSTSPRCAASPTRSAPATRRCTPSCALQRGSGLALRPPAPRRSRQALSRRRRRAPPRKRSTAAPDNQGLHEMVGNRPLRQARPHTRDPTRQGRPRGDRGLGSRAARPRRPSTCCSRCRAPASRALSTRDIARIAARRAEAADLPEDRRSPHVLPHTFCTHLVDAGADTAVIRELAGHADIPHHHHLHRSSSWPKATPTAACASGL